MDEGEMALAIAYALDEPECWKAVGFDIGEINFTNEDGEKYILSVQKVDAFFDEDEE